MGNFLPCAYCTKRGTVKVSLKGHETYEPGTNYWFFYDKQMAVLKDSIGERTDANIGFFTGSNTRITMHVIMCKSCYEHKACSLPKDHVVETKLCFRASSFTT